jgi:hypothetical protein
VLIAQIAVLLERGVDDFLEFHRDGGIQLENGRRLAIENAVEDHRG